MQFSLERSALQTSIKDLLVHLDAILQAALPKLYIDPAHLRRVLQVTTGLSPTVAPRSNPGAGQDTNHYVVNTVMDTLFDGLRNVKSIPPASITSMLQVSSHNQKQGQKTCLPPAGLLRLDFQARRIWLSSDRVWPRLHAVVRSS